MGGHVDESIDGEMTFWREWWFRPRYSKHREILIVGVNRSQPLTHIISHSPTGDLVIAEQPPPPSIYIHTLHTLFLHSHMSCIYMPQYTDFKSHKNFFGSVKTLLEDSNIGKDFPLKWMD